MLYFGRCSPNQMAYTFCPLGELIIFPFAGPLVCFPTSQTGGVERASQNVSALAPPPLPSSGGSLMNPHCYVGQYLSPNPGWDVTIIYKLPVLCSWKSPSAEMHCTVLLSLTRQQAFCGSASAAAPSMLTLSNWAVDCDDVQKFHNCGVFCQKALG